MTDELIEPIRLDVQREFDASPAAVFDAFLGLYDEPRPDWILDSQRELRVGGVWDVSFQPPGVAQFREHRVITTLEPPTHLAYTATVIGAAPLFDTSVELALAEAASGTHLVLSQSGFPTAQAREDFGNAWPDVFALVAHRLG